VIAAVADLALRRPWLLLGANLAVLGAALILALGAPDHLGTGSLTLDDGAGRAGAGAGGGAEPDLVIATTGTVPVRSGAYRIALQVITSQVRSDAQVASFRRGPISANGRSTAVFVSLRSGDATERQQAVKRIQAAIDPGPLRVVYGGEVATELDARHDLAGDLWRLELLAVPLVALILVAAVGVRLAAIPALCAATAVAGALAGLRVVGGFAHLSLLGIAPAAVLGLVLGIEVPIMLLARFRDEASMVPPAEAIRRTLQAGALAAPAVVLTTIAATAGLLVTPLGQAPSVVLACALAAALAFASALMSLPAALALGWTGASGGKPGLVSGEARLAQAPRALAGLLAHSPARTALAGALAIVAMLAAASPLLHATSRPFSAADLPAASQASKAAALVAGTRRDGGEEGSSRGSRGHSASPSARDQSLFGKLILGGLVSAAALLLVLGVGLGSPRLVPVAIVTLLPAAAACGLCVLLFQDGNLAGLIDQHRQGALETGAVASLLAALASVSAARTVAAINAVRDERWLGLGPDRAAETASGFTVPAALASTLIVATMTVVLTGSDLYPAREFGLAVAVGLILDLALLRVPLVAALARWAVPSLPATPAIESVGEPLGSPRAGGG
jgi:uncharacterized membrane protein YdfJ with MMPL/SSD domain